MLTKLQAYLKDDVWYTMSNHNTVETATRALERQVKEHPYHLFRVFTTEMGDDPFCSSVTDTSHIARYYSGTIYGKLVDWNNAYHDDAKPPVAPIVSSHQADEYRQWKDDMRQWWYNTSYDIRGDNSLLDVTFERYHPSHINDGQQAKVGRWVAMQPDNSYHTVNRPILHTMLTTHRHNKSHSGFSFGGDLIRATVYRIDSWGIRSSTGRDFYWRNGAELTTEKVEAILEADRIKYGEMASHFFVSDNGSKNDGMLLGARNPLLFQAFLDTNTLDKFEVFLGQMVYDINNVIIRYGNLSDTQKQQLMNLANVLQDVAIPIIEVRSMSAGISLLGENDDN